MAETKLPRLLAAAKEFNIVQDTLIEFLVGKGFSKDDLKPTAKLSEEMYSSLQQGFQGDKQAKTKADAIEIPKNVQQEKKRKEDVDISIKAKPVFKEEPKVEAKPEPQPEPVKEEPKPEPVAAKEEKPAEPEVVKVEAPTVEGPKVLDKIDLSTIDSSTRPKKGAKKKTEEKAEEPAPAEAEEKPKKKSAKKKTEEPAVEAPPPAPVVEQEAPKEEEPTITRIEAEKLTGPKILGKIELPVDSDTRPKQSGDNASAEEKRKRKRIPIEKKADPPQQGGFQRGGGFQRDGGGFQRGGQGGQGGGRPAAPQTPRSGNRPTIQKGGAARRDHGRPQADKEIDQKEIQDKIRETQAKLAGGGGKGKSLKSKHRREKRQEAAEASGVQDNKLQVTEFVTVSELANLMDVSFAEVISKCMSLGIMVSINQRLDAEVIELVAAEFDYEVEFIGIDDTSDIEEDDDEDNAEDLQSRAPIVTIMGHVDHGKTSLLDYIRSANVVAGEAGGITQHIGAYEVTLPNEKHITFLDTPGHEAFTAMRARGAKITDVAVIVVAADDAVMPQTKEAISHAQAAGVPMIFAVNKIDKDGANPQKIYEQLAGMNILVESWGGKFQSQELSAKKGLNVDQLLEKILLEAELLDLKANPDREASGTIIEASLDKGRGYVATLLVQNGTLKQGDLIVSGQHYGRVKAMFNERNSRTDEAPPSTPVVILGLNGAPQAGEKFKVYVDEAEAKEIATKRAQILREQGLRARKHITLDEIGRRLALGNFKELNIIIKGDVDGSVEALSDSLQKLSTQEIAVRVVHKAVGQISESDVLLATASDAIVIGFNVRPSTQASRLAENEGVQIRMYSIIYTAIDEIRSAMEGMLDPKVQEKEVANIEIREVYKFDKATVAGCYVTDGKVKRDSKIRLFRDGILIYPRQEGAFAELGSLKRFKDDVKEVASGYECGLTVKNFADIQNGDTLVAYEEEEVKRTL
jgi:translation initiation factor IF-2